MSDLENNKEQTEEQTPAQPEANEEEKVPFDDTPSVILEYFEEEGTAGQKPKVTEKLRTFYKISKIDQELFEIEEEKGDLPDVIKKLKKDCASIENQISDNQKKVIDLNEEKDKISKDNAKTEERISKFDAEKHGAKSNKEYDDIMKTIDLGMNEIEKNEKRAKEISGEIKTSIEANEELTAKLEDAKANLKEKEETLAELDESYKSEEEEMTKNYTALLSTLDTDDKNLYKRLKKMFKGEVTAIVRKGNCTGCYNSIPPQKVIEIATAEKVYTCESCGRILIPEDVVKTMNAGE